MIRAAFLLLVKMEHKNDKNGLDFNRVTYLTLQKEFLSPCYNERERIF
ncbi:conserved hypothetical protein [Chryseobacterium sp. IT-36CA2]